MNINNYESPRLAWHEASAVLQYQICKLVAENDSFVKQAVELARKERRINKQCHAVARHRLNQAKEVRDESRVLIASLETMMRGV